MKHILFTHDDLDGAGCTIIYTLAHRKLKEGIDYAIFNCSNGTVDDAVRVALEEEIITADSIVTFADISASRDVLTNLKDNIKCEVFVFDHHRTNFFVEHILSDDHRRIIPENEFGRQESGTSILYKFYCELEFAKNPIYEGFTSSGNTDLFPIFVDTVRSYDTYEWKDTGNIEAKRLQTLFILLGMKRFCKIYTHILSKPAPKGGETFLISPIHSLFIDAKLENEQNIIDNFTADDVMITNVRGYLTAVLLKSTGANFSELGYQFLRKYPDIDVIAALSMFNGGEFGFRAAKEGIDTGKEIALPLGGGGHPFASGARLPEELKADLANIFIHFLNGYRISKLEFEEANYGQG